MTGVTDEHAGRRSLADRLIGYALAAQPRLVVDQHGRPHVVADGAVLRLPQGAYPWLRLLLWEQERRGATAEALQVAAATLEAQALAEGERVDLHVRSAWLGDRLAVWLGRGRILEITAAGWQVTATSAALFRVYAGTGELPDPDPAATPSDLDDLLALLAPPDPAARRLLTAWLALAWLPHVARPALLFTGDHGAGKTTRQRLLKRVLDPAKPEAVRLDPRELVQKLAHCQIALIDNVGSVPDGVLDDLCRAVTGEADSKRVLYSDDDDFIYEYRRALLINGINPPADRADFADRLLPIAYTRLDPGAVIEETELDARCAARRAVWLGALCHLLAAAIARYPRVRPARLPRLADWGRWAACVYDAVGWGAAQFAADWAQVMERQQAAAFDGSPVAQVLITWWRDRQAWTGNATALYAELTPVAAELRLDRARGWPRSPVWLARRLRELRPLLQARGLCVEELADGHRTWRLTRADCPNPEDAPAIPSVPSGSSDPAESRHNGADETADGNARWAALPSGPPALPSGPNPRADARSDATDAADGIRGRSSGSAGAGWEVFDL